MPIRWRLTLFNAVAIGIILLVLGLALYVSLNNALTSDIEETARSRAETAARTVEAGERLYPDDMEQLTLNGVFLVIRGEDGEVLSHSPNVSARDEPRDTVWKRALEAGEGVGGKAMLSLSAPDFVYAVPVDTPDGQVRVVEAGKPYEAVSEVIETFAAILVLGILAAFALAIGGSYLLARAALSPVEAVAGSAREITEGSLSRRLPVSHPKDEIGRLTITINDLLARLEAAFDRREEALTRQRRFVADAGHELRTPLTSVRGYARMLEKWGLEDPETAREGVAAIERESERMRELVEELLALARGDEGVPLKVELQDLSPVASEAADAARISSGGKLAVDYASPDAPVPAYFDRVRIRQVADVLLDNAVKYTPEGGRVTITVRGQNGWALLEVSDTGIGISKEHLSYVFERFYRVDESRASRGMGLGLSIAQQIVEAHGGSIEVESTPHKGSRFTLQLPREPDVAKASGKDE